MATKGKNPVSHRAPHAEGTPPVPRGGAARLRTEGLQGPHFPPSENLPPQAQRLRAEKARQADRRRQTHRAEASRGGPSQLPRVPGPLAGLWHRALDRTARVLDDARGHGLRAREGGAQLWQETRELLRTPAQFLRALADARRA